MAKNKVSMKEQKKISKNLPKGPTTADEYLAAGGDFEEAGEKWRGGDAVISMSFFSKAINTYDEGLNRFSESFDLAYNKARLQYELTQHPRLVARLPETVLDLLAIALQSSRQALKLQEEDADALFNTAQILTSIAENLLDTQVLQHSNALLLLKEAIELFQHCLTLQENQHSESQTRIDASDSVTSDSEDGGVLLEDYEHNPSISEEEKWASIQEPVSNETLLDSLLAQLHSLTVLCDIVNPDSEPGLAWIEMSAAPLLTEKLPVYLTGTNRDQEAFLIRANFLTTLADANFRYRKIDLDTYQHIISESFSHLDMFDAKTLCDHAEALITLNSSACQFQSSPTISTIRWQTLTSALDSLLAASKLPGVQALAKIHLLRGDADMHRFQLGKSPYHLDVAAKNEATLLKNAQKFYRGSAALARQDGSEKEILEASCKEAWVAALEGCVDKLKESCSGKTEQIKAILEDAIQEGILTAEQVCYIGL